MELHSVSCIELQPVGWRLQCAHVKGQQVVDIVIGRLVVQPKLRLPEPVALETTANEVSVDDMQWRPQLLQRHGKCEGNATGSYQQLSFKSRICCQVEVRGWEEVSTDQMVLIL